MFSQSKDKEMRMFGGSFTKRNPWLWAALAVTLVGCGEEGAENQVVADFGIAYVKRPIPLDDNANPVVPLDPDVREATMFNGGGELYVRDRASPGASERNITDCIIQDLLATTGLMSDVYDVKDVEASYDGTKLIFSFRPEGDDPNDPPKWDIYEYDHSVGGCPTRVIVSDNIASSGDDLAPHYLPDGRIVFSSTRARATGSIQLAEGNSKFSPEDEDGNENVINLHVMPTTVTSPSDITQITFNQSHDLDPTVMANGEILFSRWDHMGARNAINLYTVRPDGTELKLLYGAHGHDVGTNNSTVQFLAPRELEDGSILAMLKPFNGSQGGGVPARIDAQNYADISQPTWPNQGILSGSGQVSAVSLDVRTDGSISPAGRFRSVYPLGDGTNRALVSWSQCRLQEVDPVDPNVVVRTMPCPDPVPNPLPANTREAFPLYGLYIYNMSDNTQLPVVIPEEDIIVEEPVVLAPRPRPTILFDKAVGLELDQNLADEGVGLLHIRSVYDFDGGFNDLNAGATATSLAEMADPTVTDADQRPARFLRIVKGAYIPDDDTRDLDNTAFGAGRQQKMREIIGYVPVEPDGSVLTKVPANIPFAISVVDKDGKRFGGRHQNWLQIRPGDTLQCNGCHQHTVPQGQVPLPHGYRDEPTALNAGAPTTGVPFSGTPVMMDVMGETMAEARIRLACGTDTAAITCPELSPSVDLRFSDMWSSAPIADRNLLYLDLPSNPDPMGRPSLVPTSCTGGWDANCRTIINYEESIHPLWNVVRADGPDADSLVDTCTSCHTENDGAVRIPAGNTQLDLTDWPNDKNDDQYNSYRELFAADDEQELVGGVLQDRPDDITLDADGNVINVVDYTVGPSMNARGARANTTFINLFAPGGSHYGRLTDTELRLIYEWLDIGAQYFNNPWHADVPVN